MTPEICPEIQLFTLSLTLSLVLYIQSQDLLPPSDVVAEIIPLGSQAFKDDLTIPITSSTSSPHYN